MERRTAVPKKSRVFAFFNLFSEGLYRTPTGYGRVNVRVPARKRRETHDAEHGVAFATVSKSLVDDIVFLRRFLASCVLEFCHALVDLIEVYEGETFNHKRYKEHQSAANDRCED